MSQSDNDMRARWKAIRENPLSKKTRSEASEGSGGWTPPVPLHENSKVPKFPLSEAFPPSLTRMREFISATAEAIQVPVDVPAMLMLPVIGASIAKKYEIELRPGWREVAGLYVMSLMGSGERKSAAFSRMTQPVLDWEAAESARLVPEIARSGEERRILETQLAEARKKAARGAGDAGAAIQLAQELAEMPVVKAPVIYTSDATSEGLAGQMLENQERALVASPEADALDVMMGRYSDHGSPNMGIWLKGHAGDSERIVRRGRPPEFLRRPVLNVAMSIQPEGARGMFSSRAARGRGLLARFLVSAPVSRVGRRKTGGDALPTPKELVEFYATTVTRLLNVPMKEAPTIIGLESQAHGLFVEFERSVEPELARGGSLGDRKDWGGKLCGAVARIALVLHAAELGQDGIAGCAGSAPLISVSTMTAALAWAPYLIEHERAVAGIVGCDPDRSGADRVLQWLERSGVNSFSERDAFDACRSETIREVGDIRTPLEFLCELHYLRPLPRPDRCASGGRPPSPQFEVNPLWKRGGAS